MVASVVGQTSGQCVKPVNSRLQRPRSARGRRAGRAGRRARNRRARAARAARCRPQRRRRRARARAARRRRRPPPRRGSRSRPARGASRRVARLRRASRRSSRAGSGTRAASSARVSGSAAPAARGRRPARPPPQSRRARSFISSAEIPYGRIAFSPKIFARSCRRDLRVAVLLAEFRRDLEGAEGLDLVLRRAVPDRVRAPQHVVRPAMLQQLAERRARPARDRASGIARCCRAPRRRWSRAGCRSPRASGSACRCRRRPRSGRRPFPRPR